MNNFNITAMNVELSEYHKQLIMRNLAPLLRLVPEQGRTECTVIIRCVRRPLGGAQYYVMVRLHGKTQDYYAVGMEHFLLRAVKGAANELRRTLSRSYRPDIETVEHLRRQQHERLFVELFAA